MESFKGSFESFRLNYFFLLFNFESNHRTSSFKMISGIESLSMDMNVKKLTIIGDIDPVAVVRKLKKWHPNILTVGPAKEEKESEKKENDGEKKEEDEEAIRRCMEACRFNNPWMRPAGLCVHVMEDDPDPTGCVIC